MTARPGRTGVLALAAYCLAALVTLRFGPLTVRPLYEGFSNPPPYHWVAPPKEQAKGNVQPRAETRPVAWSSNGNTTDSPSTSDGQAIVSIPAKAIAPKPGVEGADVSFTPVDAATLGKLPDPELRADGNAYRIEVQYSPSAEPIATLDKTAIAVMRWATNGLALYYAPDGRQWRKLTDDAKVTPAPSALVSANWAGNGYYLAVAHGALGTAPPARKGVDIGTIVSGVLIVVPIAGIVWFVFPRKRDELPPKKSGGSRKQPARGKKRR